MIPCSTTPFTVNGRTYTPPARPVAVICLDGSADEYLDAALARGRMPHLARISVSGWRGLARSGGQNPPPAVEVRPGELPGATEGVDRLPGSLPVVDGGPPGADLLGAVCGHAEVLPRGKLTAYPTTEGVS